MQGSVQKLELIGACVLLLFELSPSSTGRAQQVGPSPVYIVMWFDTEDYILPSSDDAAKRLADFLTAEGLHATFKVVGEKARTLERRGRSDVIAALRDHDIGISRQYAQPTSYARRIRIKFGLEHRN